MIFLYIILAAFFNSVMDLLENENFHASRFSKWNQKFWYKRESWKTARKIIGYKIDGWHLSKSIMICFLLVPIAHNWKEYLLLGFTWNLAFVLFYKLLKK